MEFRYLHDFVRNIYVNEYNIIIGDVAETIADFFEGSEITKSSKSRLTLYDIDTFLSKLSTLTKEDEQAAMLGNIAKKSTTNDLKMIIRLIKGDLRINAGTVCFLVNIHMVLKMFLSVIIEVCIESYLVLS